MKRIIIALFSALLFTLTVQAQDAVAEGRPVYDATTKGVAANLRPKSPGDKPEAKPTEKAVIVASAETMAEITQADKDARLAQLEAENYRLKIETELKKAGDKLKELTDAATAATAKADALLAAKLGVKRAELVNYEATPDPKGGVTLKKKEEKK